MSAAGVAAAVVAHAAAAVGIAGAGYVLDVPKVISPPPSVDTAVAGAGADRSAGKAPEGRSFVIVNEGGKTPTRTTADRNSGWTTTPTSAPVPACAASDRQREVEGALATLPEYDTVVVDGRQSAADCAVIRRFQQRFAVAPANGQTDDTTADVARRIAVSATAAEQRKCAPAAGVTACVDLTQQTAWVVRDGKIVVGPTVVRTGFRGHATPAGTYRINKRDLREWSEPYEVWLPYWQRFVGGIGFHEATTYLHDGSLGSHGCVNLLPADARAMWDALSLGATVHTFGRRPGT